MDWTSFLSRVGMPHKTTVKYGQGARNILYFGDCRDNLPFDVGRLINCPQKTALSAVFFLMYQKPIDKIGEICYDKVSQMRQKEVIK